MIETREREVLAPPRPTDRPQEQAPKGGRKRRGWWMAVLALFVVAAIAIGVVASRPGTPIAPAGPAGRGHPRFHQLPELVPTTDGSKVDLSDQAFRHGLVKLDTHRGGRGHVASPPPVTGRYGPR